MKKNRMIGTATIGRLATKSEVWKQLATVFTSTLLLGGAAAFADVNDGLVAHYPLDGNGTNVLGTGNDGVLSGVTPASDRFGNPTGACYFDGSAVIDMPSGPPISPTSSITYAFWLVSTYDGQYVSSNPGAWYWLWWLDRKSESGPLFGLALMLEPYGQFWFAPRTDDGTWPTNWLALTGGQLTPQTWQHIAMVRDYGNAFRLYVDGVLVASDWDNGSPLTLPPVRLGKHAWNGDMGFVGLMDDFRIYNRALSEAEIQELASGDVDTDGDGVPDASDQCPGTPAGEIVNAVGCSISQLVPASWPWRNHGEYVSAVSLVAREFLAQGLITEAQHGAIISAAARSDIGKRR